MDGSSRRTKVLLAQHAAFIRDPYPNLLVQIDEGDISVWYFLIVGLDKPYEGGEYMFKLTAPPEFPQKPPSFEFLTPNGLFELGGKICISIGEYHADSEPGKQGSYGWRPSLGMKGFAIEVVNALISFVSTDHGIRIVNMPDSFKIACAKESRSYNAKHYTYQATLFESAITSEESSPAMNAKNGRRKLVGLPLVTPKVSHVPIGDVTPSVALGPPPTISKPSSNRDEMLLKPPLDEVEAPPSGAKAEPPLSKASVEADEASVSAADDMDDLIDSLLE